MSPRRVAGGCCVALLIFVLIMLVVALLEPSKRSGTGAAIVVLGLLIVLLIILIWLFFRSPRMAKTGYQWDLLRQGLNLNPIPEKDGIQWTMLAFPDSLRAPGYLVLAFLVQNCTTASRQIRLKLSSSPLNLSREYEFDLPGGQAGVYRVPLLFPSGLSSGPLTVEYAVSGRAVGGKGDRVIKNMGAGPRAALHFRQVTVEILPGGSGAPVNEFARSWSGFQPIFETGRTAPDLEPLRLLEELRSTS